MNPGKLRGRGFVLRLSGTTDLRWESLAGVWISGKAQGGKTYSPRWGSAQTARNSCFGNGI